MIWPAIGMVFFGVVLYAVFKGIEAEDVKRVERLRRQQRRF